MTEEEMVNNQIAGSHPVVVRRIEAQAALIAEMVAALRPQACDCTERDECPPQHNWPCKHKTARDLIAKAKAVQS